MWWAIWCAAVMAGGACAAPAPGSSDALAPFPPMDLVQIDSPAPDDESMSYGVASLQGGRFANAPWIYLLSEMPRGSQSMVRKGEWRARPKRKMPSLSISNPMEVLRQRLMLEVARKQLREASQRQAVANRVFLQNVGKRGFWANAARARYDN